MRNIAVLVLTVLFLSSTAFADNDRKDPYGDKLMIAGATTFTLSYAPMSIWGTMQAASVGDAAGAGISYLPVGGPLYYGGVFASFGQGHNGTQTLAMLSFIDGAVQIAGISLMIAGSVHQHRAAARTTTTASLR